MKHLQKLNVFKEDKNEEKDTPFRNTDNRGVFVDVVKKEKFIPKNSFHKKEIVIQKLTEAYGEKLGKCLNSSMTKEELLLYEKAYLLHEDNPQRLSELHLSEKQLNQMVNAMQYRLDLAEEIISGISDEDLNNLLEVLEKGYDLRDVFTEDGAFIDYEKIKNFIEG